MKVYTLLSASGAVVSSGGKVISLPLLLQDTSITERRESTRIADMIFFILVFLSLTEIFGGDLKIYKRSLGYFGKFFNVVGVVVFKLIGCVTPFGIRLKL